MSDLAINFLDDVKEWDLSLFRHDLQVVDGLKSAILISLFSDSRAEEDEIPEGETLRRGWWGDSINNDIGNETGSKLWLLDREKTTDETLEAAEEYCRAALQWLLDDGIAESVEVQTSYTDKYTMLIEIQITRPTGLPVDFKFNYVWDAREAGL